MNIFTSVQLNNLFHPVDKNQNFSTAITTLIVSLKYSYYQ